MEFAQVEGGEVVAIGEPPRLVRDPVTGDLLADFTLPDSRTSEAYAAVGWFEIVRTPRPADSPDGSWVAKLEVIDGIPTETWDLEPWTADELAARAAGDVQRTIEEALVAALVELQTIIDTTNATLNATPAPAIKALARAMRRMIRLQLRRLDASA